jgi:hypothetical protein
MTQRLVLVLRVKLALEVRQETAKEESVLTPESVSE